MNGKSYNDLIKIRVILANGIPLIRQALKEYIKQEQDMEVVGETGDGEETLAIASKLHPDIILMDLVLSSMDGLEATKRIVRTCPGTKVLVLTITENSDLKHDILYSGASGCLSINTPCGAIIHAMRQISNNGKAFKTAAFLNPEEESLMGKPPFSNITTKLTIRELSILKMVATGVSNKEIAQSLNLSLHYVKACLTNIFTKLSVTSRTEAVSIALKSGIIELSDLHH